MLQKLNNKQDADNQLNEALVMAQIKLAGLSIETL